MIKLQAILAALTPHLTFRYLYHIWKWTRWTRYLALANKKGLKRIRFKKRNTVTAGIKSSFVTIFTSIFGQELRLLLLSTHNYQMQFSEMYRRAHKFVSSQDGSFILFKTFLTIFSNSFRAFCSSSRVRFILLLSWWCKIRESGSWHQILTFNMASHWA